MGKDIHLPKYCLNIITVTLMVVHKKWKCEDNISHCEKCEDYHCGSDTCPGKGSYGANQDCFDCPDNCRECETPEKCTKCEPFFAISVDGKKASCVDCPLHCINCTMSAGRRDNQGSNEKDRSKEYSQALPTLENDATICEKCDSGYFFNKDKTQCNKCDSDCSECEGSSTNCVDKNGKGGPRKCEPCMEGCANCFEVGAKKAKGKRKIKCKDPLPGYFIYDNGYACKACGTGCLSCTSKDKHTKCEPTYRLTKKGTCAKCNPKNCVICKIEENVEICSQCTTGYYVTSKGKCKKMKENHCADWDENNQSVCEDGHWYNIATDSCKACNAKHCKRCPGDPDDCTICEDDYYLYYDRDDPRWSGGPRCRSIFDCEQTFCKVCNNTDFHCTKCIDNFELNRATDTCDEIETAPCSQETECGKKCGQRYTNHGYTHQKSLCRPRKEKLNCSNYKNKEKCQDRCPGFVFNSALKKCIECKEHFKKHGGLSLSQCTECPQYAGHGCKYVHCGGSLDNTNENKCKKCESQWWNPATMKCELASCAKPKKIGTQVECERCDLLYWDNGDCVHVADCSTVALTEEKCKACRKFKRYWDGTECKSYDPGSGFCNFHKNPLLITMVEEECNVCPGLWFNTDTGNCEEVDCENAIIDTEAKCIACWEREWNKDITKCVGLGGDLTISSGWDGNPFPWPGIPGRPTFMPPGLPFHNTAFCFGSAVDCSCKEMAYEGCSEIKEEWCAEQNLYLLNEDQCKKCGKIQGVTNDAYWNVHSSTCEDCTASIDQDVCETKCNLSFDSLNAKCIHCEKDRIKEKHVCEDVCKKTWSYKTGKCLGICNNEADKSTCKKCGWKFSKSTCTKTKNACGKKKSHHCLSCTGSGCTQCQENYYIDDGKCHSCFDEDNLPRTERACDMCNNTFFSGTCHPCRYGCYKCRSSSDCEMCIDDYQGGITVPEATMYMATSNLRCGSERNICLKNFFIPGQEGCQERYSKNCIECTNRRQCTKCRKGWFLNGAMCEECQKECYKCSQTGGCEECAPGFYINNKRCLEMNQDSHEACSTSCTSPGNCDPQKFMSLWGQVSRKACRPCTIGFYSSWIFPKCKSSHCNVCEANYEKCIKCEDGYYWNETDVDCRLCNDRPTCVRCTADKCIECMEGYVVNPYTGNCRACSPGCEICEAHNHCAKCTPGMIPFPERLPTVVCKNCTKGVKPKVCGYCEDGNVCERCKGQYVLSKDGKTCQPACYTCRKDCPAKLKKWESKPCPGLGNINKCQFSMRGDTVISGGCKGSHAQQISCNGKKDDEVCNSACTSHLCQPVKASKQTSSRKKKRLGPTAKKLLIAAAVVCACACIIAAIACAAIKKLKCR